MKLLNFLILSSCILLGPIQVIAQSEEEDKTLKSIRQCLKNKKINLEETPLPKNLPDAYLLNGDISFITCLINSGLAVDGRNEQEETLFIKASSNNDFDMMQFLVEEYDVDVNAQDNEGRTALFWNVKNNLESVKNNNLESVKENNLESVKENNLESVKENNLEIAQFLVSKGAVSKTPNNKVTDLLIASQEQYFEMAKLLVEEAKADVNAQTDFGWTALLNAVKNNDLKMAQYLLNNGAKVNATNKAGRSPLMIAAVNNYLAMAELLVKYGAELNQIDSYGWTALLFAEDSGHTEMANFLKSKGAKKYGLLRRWYIQATQ